MITTSRKLRTIKEKKSLFCIGLDPSVEQLNRFNLDISSKGLYDYCHRIIEASANEIGIFKPQYAYFERFGPEGIQVLCDIIQMIHEFNGVSILDCKKSDIGSTMQAYAEGLIGDDSIFKVDSSTAVAYLGFDSLAPLISRAVNTGTLIFVIVHSSNPEGLELQISKFRENETVAESLIRQVNLSRENVGAVIGATLKKENMSVNRVLQKLDKTWVLSPVIGAQGARIGDLKDLFHNNIDYVIPSASRSILENGFDLASIKAKAISYKEQLLDLYK